MFRTLATTAVAAFALSGCLSSLLPEAAPAPTIYRLTDPAPAGTKSPGAVVVRVDNVSAPRTYQTSDIIVITADRTVSAAEGALWADDIPEIIQDAMLTQFAATERYIGVIPVAGARSRLRLHLDVRDFSTVYDQGDLAAPVAKVHVYATVSEAASREFVGSFDAVAEMRADDNTIRNIVDATSEATREALRDVVTWMDTLPVDLDARTG